MNLSSAIVCKALRATHLNDTGKAHSLPQTVIALITVPKMDMRTFKCDALIGEGLRTCRTQRVRLKRAAHSSPSTLFLSLPPAFRSLPSLGWAPRPSISRMPAVR